MTISGLVEFDDAGTIQVAVVGAQCIRQSIACEPSTLVSEVAAIVRRSHRIARIAQDLGCDVGQRGDDRAGLIGSPDRTLLSEDLKGVVAVVNTDIVDEHLQEVLQDWSQAWTAHRKMNIRQLRGALRAGPFGDR